MMIMNDMVAILNNCFMKGGTHLDETVTLKVNSQVIIGLLSCLRRCLVAA